MSQKSRSEKKKFLKKPKDTMNINTAHFLPSIRVLGLNLMVTQRPSDVETSDDILLSSLIIKLFRVSCHDTGLSSLLLTG